jgi:hypothetical protein
MNLTDEEIKSNLRAKIKEAYYEYLSRTDKYIKALEALGENIELTPKEQLPIEFVDNGKSVTFAEKVKDIIADAGKPLTAREVMEILNAKYNTNYVFDNNYSGKFSQAYKRAKMVKYYRPKDVPFNKRIVYGLKEWFEDNELKQEYKEKLGDLI